MQEYDRTLFFQFSCQNREFVNFFVTQTRKFQKGAVPELRLEIWRQPTTTNHTNEGADGILGVGFFGGG